MSKTLEFLLKRKQELLEELRDVEESINIISKPKLKETNMHSDDGINPMHLIGYGRGDD